MQRSRGFTLIEILVVIAVIGILATLLVPVMTQLRERAQSASCQNNLKQLGTAIQVYLDSTPTTRPRYPEHDGALFLVHLYRSGLVQDANLFLCPATIDGNDEGKKLMTGPVPPDACSFMARLNGLQGTYPGILGAKGASETSVAADDDEGSDNHPISVNILFLDGHVEVYNIGDPKLPQREAGSGHLLDPLGN